MVSRPQFYAIFFGWLKFLKIASTIYRASRQCCEHLEGINPRIPTLAGYRHNLAWLRNLDDDDDPTEELLTLEGDRHD
ncbi:MAG: hypothetical protein HC771_17505 [Synechococcales cyanobacterium CRU_2_2]|nr:hypothetical protein [Synechococcales cyanobacterium CRU_2_2]